MNAESPQHSRQVITLKVHETLLKAPLYKKTVQVEAYRTTEETVLKTILSDGTVETERTVPAGHYVITNPGGEQYAVDAERFVLSYNETSTPGVYLSTGIVHAMPNPWGEPIAILAPWGELQYAPADSYLVVSTRSRELPYLVDGESFRNTYS